MHPYFTDLACLIPSPLSFSLALTKRAETAETSSSESRVGAHATAASSQAAGGLLDEQPRLGHPHASGLHTLGPLPCSSTEC